MPSTDQVALQDASQSAAGAFNVNIVIWSGNLLFLFLAHDASFKKFMLAGMWHFVNGKNKVWLITL